MELRSQEVRTLAPENDPLKMGMGWKVEDLSKPQIMVLSSFWFSSSKSVFWLFISLRLLTRRLFILNAKKAMARNPSDRILTMTRDAVTMRFLRTSA